MTTTITNSLQFSFKITALFWFYFPGVLFDGRNSIPISPPSNCTGDKCSSYFIPGYLSTVNYTADYNITASNYSTADTFITIDAPGYQVDFGPPESSDPPVTLQDCQLFGYDKMSLQICLKQIDSSTFIAGKRLLIRANSSLGCLSYRYWGSRAMPDSRAFLANCRTGKHQNDGFVASRYDGL
jgi:hypothetical protein